MHRNLLVVSILSFLLLCTSVFADEAKPCAQAPTVIINYGNYGIVPEQKKEEFKEEKIEDELNELEEEPSSNKSNFHLDLSAALSERDYLHFELGGRYEIWEYLALDAKARKGNEDHYVHLASVLQIPLQSSLIKFVPVLGVAYSDWKTPVVKDVEFTAFLEAEIILKDLLLIGASYASSLTHSADFIDYTYPSDNFEEARIQSGIRIGHNTILGLGVFDRKQGEMRNKGAFTFLRLEL